MKDKVEAYVKKHHENYTLVNAGDFEGWGDWIITNENYEETWEHVIRKRKYSSFWHSMDKCLDNYYANNYQLIYKDIPL